MAKKVIGILIIAALAFAACNDKPEGSEYGCLNAYIVDGMADYDSIFVSIDSGYAYTDIDSLVYTLINDSLLTVPVSRLRNGNYFIYAKPYLLPQDIDGLELVISGGRIVIDSLSYQLQLVNDSSAIHCRVPGNIRILRSKHTNVLLEINLFESIVYDNVNETYTLTPSFRLVNFDSVGTISGNTSPKANIYLFQHGSDDTLSYTSSENDTLFFKFAGLLPGAYDILCKPIGSDTIYYGDLLNTNVPVVKRDDYDMGILDLPQAP